MRASVLFLGSMSLCAITLARPARGALGEPAASIESDRVALRATAVAKRAGAGYTVHEVRAGSTLVREFVAPSGLVFAVAWDGLAHPDLGPLLGRYATEVSEARRGVRAHGARRRGRVESDHVVLETWGRMRSLHGRAFVPALVP